MHEIVHREYNHLSKKEKEIIDNAYYNLRDRNLIKVKKEHGGALLQFEILINKKEFAPYLINRYLKDDVIKILKDKFPQAYEIIKKIENRARYKLKRKIRN